jgi:hypothetical protein
MRSSRISFVLLACLVVGGTTDGATLSTYDGPTIAAFKAGRTVLTFDEINVSAPPYYLPLNADTYLSLGISIRARTDGSVQTYVAQLPQLGDFGPTLSPPNVIGGGPGPDGWRQAIRFDFVGLPATAFGANTDWTGSNTTLTAYDATDTVIASVSGDQGSFMGVVAPGISHAIWTWNHDESVVGFSLDNVTFSSPLPGDVDGDGHVDVVDLLYFVDAFGSASGDANYDPTCDFNSDGSVDVVDLLILVENFGKY